MHNDARVFLLLLIVQLVLASRSRHNIVVIHRSVLPSVPDLVLLHQHLT